MNDAVDPAVAEDLVARARAARDHAYAPYSRFHVGAALVTEDGDVFEGANVENASYGLSICAERVAAVQAATGGRSRRIVGIAVAGSASDPTPPCGACRQFLYEFNPEMVVISVGPDDRRARWTLAELLVDGFGPSNLRDAGLP